MGNPLLEERLRGVPEHLQLLVHRRSFRREGYHPLEEWAIQWQEKETLRQQHGRTRKTGGPQIRHSRDVFNNMLALNHSLQGKHRIFKEAYGQNRVFGNLVQIARTQGISLDPTGTFFPMELCMLSTGIPHDDLEDHSKAKLLIQKYKDLKDERDRLVAELRIGRARQPQKRKDLRRVKGKITRTRAAIRKFRSNFLNDRNSRFVAALDNAYDILVREHPHLMGPNPFALKGAINNQIYLSIRLLKYVTRYSEERSYQNSMYHLFDREGCSSLDVLRKALAKPCDLIANTVDRKPAYTPEEAAELEDLFSKKPDLVKMYGEIDFNSKELQIKNIVYTATKAITFLNSLNRRVFNSGLAEQAIAEGFFYQHLYLNLVLLAKDRLMTETTRALREQKETLEKSTHINLAYQQHMAEQIQKYREQGGYDKATSKGDGDSEFGHGTLEIITNKNRTKQQISGLSPKETSQFWYGNVLHLLEVMHNFQNMRGKRFNQPKQWKYFVLENLAYELRPRVIS